MKESEGKRKNGRKWYGRERNGSEGRERKGN